MPKVSWVKPKVNYLKCLLTEYRKAKNMTYEKLGKLVGCSAQNCKQQISKPADMWRIKDLKLYCEALDVPIEDAVLAAIQK
jgi:hypothetical protein